MAIKFDDIAVTGSHGGVTGYLVGNLNVFRKTSSLTAARVKKDPAFAGFRASGNRMKLASPIASDLYRLIPEHLKQFSLYRTLTGEALNMIKEGLEKEEIISLLRHRFIEPLLAPVTKGRKQKKKMMQSMQHQVRDTIAKSKVSVRRRNDEISSSNSDLIYFGRAKEYPKLKIWIRMSPGPQRRRE